VAFEDLGAVAADHDSGGEAGDALGGGVKGGNAPVHIRGDDAFGDAVEDVAQEFVLTVEPGEGR
jgi:hypothetical protein